MAFKKQKIRIKSYRRRDGTRVKPSFRKALKAVEVVKARKQRFSTHHTISAQEYKKLKSKPIKQSVRTLNRTDWTVDDKNNLRLLKENGDIDSVFGEIAASFVSEQLDIPCNKVRMVPPTLDSLNAELRPSRGKKTFRTLHDSLPKGSKDYRETLDPSEYTDNQLLLGYSRSENERVFRKCLEREDLTKILTMDTYFAHTDRNLGNLMYNKEEDKYYAIDNGFCAETDSVESTDIRESIGSLLGDSSFIKDLNETQRKNLNIFEETLNGLVKQTPSLHKLAKNVEQAGGGSLDKEVFTGLDNSETESKDILDKLKKAREEEA